jgi:PhnB protein
LTVRDASRAIDFYQRAFGAELRGNVAKDPGGKVMHAELKIGDSIIMLSDEYPEFGSPSPQSGGSTSMGLHLYVDDVDNAFDRAVKAGAHVDMPVADQFWGDRYGRSERPLWSQMVPGDSHKSCRSRADAARHGGSFCQSRSEDAENRVVDIGGEPTRRSSERARSCRVWFSPGPRWLKNAGLAGQQNSQIPQVVSGGSGLNRIAQRVE